MRDNGGAALIDTDNIHPTNAGHAVIAEGVLTKTVVLNEQDAPTILAAATSGADFILSWAPTLGAVSHQVATAPYDTLTISAATAESSTQHTFAAPGGAHVLMVRAVFSGGAGPWSVSPSLTVAA